MDREITKYDAEGICKIYCKLRKKCELIDKSIYRTGISFSVLDCGNPGLYVFEYISKLMEEKNKLINFKLLIDACIKRLELKDRQMIMVKIYYPKLQIDEIGGIFELKQRTVFRRFEKAFEHFAEIVNKSKYRDKIIKILEEPDNKADIEEIEQRRKAFKSKEKEECK